MIILDIETSGSYAKKHGVWQIGAIEFENPSNYFFDECRIDDEDEIQQEALEVTGKTKEELRDKEKQSQKELLIKFFKWIEGVKIKNFVCQNPHLVDYTFIFERMIRYNLISKINLRIMPFPYRVFDLHSVAQAVYHQINGKFLINKDKNNSAMNLKEIMMFCGFPGDPRNKHNAFEDAKISAECFSRLLYGTGLFDEYTKHKIPGYLKLNKEKKENAV